MPRRGSWEMRNVGYKERREAEYAGARTDDERLEVAFDWFRASVSLLARRRIPLGRSQQENRDAAVHIIRRMAAFLADTAQAIDRGDYDAGRR